MTRKKPIIVITVFLSITAMAVVLIFNTRDERLPVSLEAIETSNGWGYKIDVDGKTFIRQTTIPAIDGDISFSTREQALLVGNHAINKLKKGRLPQITAEELKEWGMIKNASFQ